MEITEIIKSVIKFKLLLVLYLAMERHQKYNVCTQVTCGGSYPSLNDI